MNAAFLMLIPLLLLPPLTAALCAMGQFTLLEQAPRFAILPPVTTAVTAAANTHLLAGASGPAAWVWLLFLLCAVYAFPGTLVGLGVGAARHIQKRRRFQ